MNMIKDFKDKHKDEPCFLIGTGPSLNDVDVSLLNDKLTFGCSRTFLMPDLKLNYYGVESERTVRNEQIGIEMLECDAKFLPQRFKNTYFGDNTVFVNFPHSYPDFPKFSFDCGEIVYWGCNVLYMLLQIAAYMGCNPLYLVGINWWRNPEDMQLHFHTKERITDYDPPRVAVQNQGMAYAAKVLKEHNVQVYNLCPESYLKAFPFKKISEVL